MDYLKVAAELLAVPASARFDGNELVLDIVVQISPAVMTDNSIELAQWPEEIAIRSQSLVVSLTSEYFDTQPYEVDSGLRQLTGDDNIKRRQQMVETWRKIFPSESELTSLMRALELGGNDTDNVMSLHGGYQSYRTAVFADLFERIEQRVRKDSKSDSDGDSLIPQSVLMNLVTVAQTAINTSNVVADSYSRSLNPLDKKPVSEVAPFIPENELDALFSGIAGKASANALSDEDVKQHCTTLYQSFVDFLACFGKQAKAPIQLFSKALSAEDEALEAATRRLFGIMSHPSLAYWLGCGVPLQIKLSANDAENLMNSEKPFVLSVNFKDQSGISAGTVVKIIKNGSQLLFEAVSRTNLKSGLCLDFSSKIDGQYRFKFSSITPSSTIFQLMDIANRSERAKIDDVQLVRSKKRGLVLYDFAAPEMSEHSNRRQNLNYLEDIIIGLRPDFKRNDSSDNCFYAIMQRRVNWLIDTDESRDFFSSEVMRKVQNLQDDGFVPWPAPPPIQAHYNKGVLNFGMMQKSDEIFIWNGEPGGIEFQEEVVAEKGDDLGISREYYLPDPFDQDGEVVQANLLPGLRVDNHYNLGCRFVLPLGVSVSLDEAQILYRSGLNYVDSTNREPVLYVGHEVPAPGVHILWKNEPLVDAKTPALTHPGEAVNNVVIGPEHGFRQRIITPPRIGFTDAECEGQFDAIVDVEFPTGAFGFNSQFPAWMFTEDAMFPEVRRVGDMQPGFWFTESEGNNESDSNDTKKSIVQISLSGVAGQKIPIADLDGKNGSQSRGAIFILGKPVLSTRSAIFSQGYFAAKKGSELVSTLNVKGKDSITLSNKRRFWGEAQSPSEAAPIVLQVIEGSTDSDYTDSDFYKLTGVDGLERELPLIEVAVAPGDEGNIELKVASDGIFAKTHKVSFVHALRKPRFAPSYTDPKTGKATLTITFGQTNKDIATISGDIFKVDRRVTGHLRGDAEWFDYTENTYVELPDGKWVENLAVRQDTLFNIEPTFDRELESLSLASNTDFIGSLDTKFTDQRARKLKVRLVATSRFSKYFPDGAGTKIVEPGVPAIGPFDAASESFPEANTIWLNCAFSPPEPKVRRIHPVLVWENKNTDRYNYKIVRKNRLRIYLDSNWFATGEGEKLGIVLLDPVGFRVDSIKDFENDDLKPFKDIITRPARLAYLSGPKSSLYLTEKDFGLTQHNSKSVNLSLLPNEDGVTKSLKVRVLPFEVEFSEKEGLYCDVQLNSENMSAVHFGLVRYQEHAAEQSRVSPPICETIALNPDYEIEVSLGPTTHERTVTVRRSVRCQTKDSQKSSIFLARQYKWEETSKYWLGEMEILPKKQDFKGADFNFKVDQLRDGSWVMLEEYEILEQDFDINDAIATTKSIRRCVFQALVQLP